MIKNKRVKYFIGVILILFVARFAYKYSPRRVEFLGSYNKVWAHRVNSQEKLASAINYFEGVELDLIYHSETQTLDVVHPPAPSIGLSLEEYLVAIPKNKQPNLWLDIKNLTSKNAIEVNERIAHLIETKNYTVEKVIIESQNPDALRLLEASTFQRLYYLPIGLHKKTPAELENTIASIQEVLSMNKPIGISSNYEDYEVLAKHFPYQNKYLWKIDGLTLKNYFKTRKILKDTTVKVVLSRYKSFKGNR